MNEAEELKTKLSEAGGILKGMVRAKLDHVRARTRGLEKPNRNLALLALLILPSFAIGFSLGSLTAHVISKKQNTAGTNPAAVSTPSKPNAFWSYFFGREIPVPGPQQDGTFVLSDFETDDALLAWGAFTGGISISREIHGSGTGSGKVLFLAKDKPASVTVDRYFSSPKGLFDWTDFKALSFHLYNPQTEPATVTLQVMDRKKRHFKLPLELKARAGQTFIVPTEKMAGDINLKRISHLRFFIWHLDRDVEFYVDDVKLLPSSEVTQS